MGRTLPLSFTFLLAAASVVLFIGGNRIDAVPNGGSGGIFNLTIIHTGSLDGRVSSDGLRGGFASLKTFVEAQRNARMTNTSILINAYNTLGTDSFFREFRMSNKMRNYMEQVGYDYLGLGAGDFFYGPEALQNFLSGARYQLVATNLDVRSTHPLYGLIKRSYIHTAWIENIQRRIGIVSIVDEAICSRSTCGLVVFTRNSISSTQEAVNALIAENVDLIIAISGAGYISDINLISSLSGIDLVVSNTFNKNNSDPNATPYPFFYNDLNGKPVPFVATQGLSSYAGVLDIGISNGVINWWNGNSLVVQGCSDDSSPSLDCYIADGSLKASIAEDEATLLLALQKTVGESLTLLPGDTNRMCRLSECALGNLVTDAMRYGVSESCDVAIVNGGSLRAPIAVGNVTQGIINSVVPFANFISTFLLQGSDMIDMFQYAVNLIDDMGTVSGTGRFLQVSGVKLVIDIAKPDFLKIVSLQVQNRFKQYEEVIRNQLYYVCGNDFIRRAGDGYTVLLNKAQQVNDNGPPLVSAMREFISEFSPISYGLESRIVIINSTETFDEVKPIIGATCQYSTSIVSPIDGSAVYHDPCTNATRDTTSSKVKIVHASFLATPKYASITLNSLPLIPGVDFLTILKADGEVASFFHNGEFKLARFTGAVGSTGGIPKHPLVFFEETLSVNLEVKGLLSGEGLAFAYSMSLSCPDGFILNEQECVPCQPGTFSLKGDAECSNCPPGTYSDVLASGVCKSCEINFFNPFDMQTSCQSCNNGRIWLTETKCECPEGMIYSNFKCVEEASRNVGVQAVFIALALVFLVLVFVVTYYVHIHIHLKVFRSASPLFMNIISAGTVMALVTVFLSFSEVSTGICTTRAWMFHIAFGLAFGSLYMKTYRISFIVNIKKNARANLRDESLLYRLFGILAVLILYLIIWTAVDKPTKHLIVTPNTFYYICTDSWWNHTLLIIEVLFILWGVLLAYKVRKAPAGFNEAKLIGFSVYNWLILSVLLNIVRLTTDPSADAVAALDSLSVFLTFFVMFCVLFFPKIYMAIIGRGDQVQWTTHAEQLSPIPAAFSKPSPKASNVSKRNNQDKTSEAGQTTFADVTTVAGTENLSSNEDSSQSSSHDAGTKQNGESRDVKSLVEENALLKEYIKQLEEDLELALKKGTNGEHQRRPSTRKTAMNDSGVEPDESIV